MKFFISSSLSYQVSGPAHILCCLRCAPSAGQVILEETLSTSPEAVQNEINIGVTDRNSITRLDVELQGNFNVQYQGAVEINSKLVKIASIGKEEQPFPDATVIPYLFPSRYVPADRMRNIARDLFGDIKGHLAQAIAIEKWLFQNVSYVSGVSTEQTWSLDTFESRAGVCRDFAHLGISLCRALGIPARYVTAYAYQLFPADFHAIFEVYVNGSWIAFDGTRSAPLNGIIRIAHGRDAADVAVANLFGDVNGQGVLVNVQISNQESAGFTPVNRESLQEQDSVLILDGTS